MASKIVVNEEEEVVQNIFADFTSKSFFTSKRYFLQEKNRVTLTDIFLVTLVSCITKNYNLNKENKPSKKITINFESSKFLTKINIRINKKNLPITQLNFLHSILPCIDIILGTLESKGYEPKRQFPFLSVLDSMMNHKFSIIKSTLKDLINLRPIIYWKNPFATTSKIEEKETHISKKRHKDVIVASIVSTFLNSISLYSSGREYIFPRQIDRAYYIISSDAIIDLNKTINIKTRELQPYAFFLLLILYLTLIASSSDEKTEDNAIIMYVLDNYLLNRIPDAYEKIFYVLRWLVDLDAQYHRGVSAGIHIVNSGLKNLIIKILTVAKQFLKNNRNEFTLFHFYNLLIILTMNSEAFLVILSFLAKASKRAKGEILKLILEEIPLIITKEILKQLIKSSKWGSQKQSSLTVHLAVLYFLKENYNQLDRAITRGVLEKLVESFDVNVRLEALSLHYELFKDKSIAQKLIKDRSKKVRILAQKILNEEDSTDTSLN